MALTNFGDGDLFLFYILYDIYDGFNVFGIIVAATSVSNSYVAYKIKDKIPM